MKFLWIFVILLIPISAEAFSEFREQSITIIPQKESNVGMFYDNLKEITVIDFGTVFTIAGNGTIPDVILFDGRTITKDWISPISKHGDWEYMREKFVATDFRAEKIFTIDLVTNDEITYSYKFEVRQVTNNENIHSQIPLWVIKVNQFWKDQKISDSEFQIFKSYLIKNGIINKSIIESLTDLNIK